MHGSVTPSAAKTWAYQVDIFKNVRILGAEGKTIPAFIWPIRHGYSLSIEKQIISTENRSVRVMFRRC